MSLLQPSKSVKFGRYELVRRIGFGGMGEVWLALLPGSSGIHKVCVVKKILAHLAKNPSFVERFLDEAKVVVHLAHGNIAQVFEMGREGDEYFMAMEYVEGKTLGRICARLREKGERFPLPLALHLGIRACDALAYAHGRTDPTTGRPLEIVHRDVSPSNVMISYDGEVKVIDFGAAHSAVKDAQTGPRVVIGNLAYMSPEQARKRPVDARADVYSVAVVLWELAAWQQVLVPEDKAERWRRAAYPQFVPPTRFRPELPPELDDIIMRGLFIDPRERYANADELRDALMRVLAQIGPETSQTTLATFMRQHFQSEASADRALVAEALGVSEDTVRSPAPPEFAAGNNERTESVSRNISVSVSVTREAPPKTEEGSLQSRTAPLGAVSPPPARSPSGRVVRAPQAPNDEDDPTVTVTRAPSAGQAPGDDENSHTVTATALPAPTRRPKQAKRPKWLTGALLFLLAFGVGVGLALATFSLADRAAPSSGAPESRAPASDARK